MTVAFAPTDADIARFFAKVRKTRGCWIWTPSLNAHGYGVFWFQGRYVYAHQFSKQLVTPKPGARWEIDHVVCDRKDCVRPDHVEWVRVKGRPNTVRHFARQTSCRRGHRYTAANVYRWRGRRRCRTCRRDADRRRSAS